MFSWVKTNKILLAIIIVIISVSIQVKCADDVTKFVGAAQNLTVFAFEDYDYDGIIGEDRNIEGGLLKLNISWLPPNTGRSPVSYSVVVTTVQNESVIHQTACPEENLFYTTKNASQLYVELPEDPVIFGVSELTITPGCQYEVQVYANPRRNPNIKHPSVNYKVPECVGLQCGCLGIEEILPKPEVRVQRYGDDRFHIRWKLPTKLDNIKSYIISFGVPILISSGGLPVYNITEIAHVPSINHSFVWSNVDKNFNGIVSVVAEDWNGCSGPRGSYSINPIKSNNNHRRKVVFIGSVIISVLILGIASILWSHDRDRYDLVFSNTDSKDFHSPATLSRNVQPFTDKLLLTKRNAFYVEQEIEEARKNGQADALEISYSRINFKKELGNGQFGKVYLANIDGFDESPVAVKITNISTMSDDAEARAQLLEEIGIMKIAGPHPHLVQLIGCCTLPANPVCAILEYLEGGDLLVYLHHLRKRLSGSFESLTIDSSSARSPRPSLTETLYTTLGSEPPTTPTSDTFTVNNEELAFENSHNYMNASSHSSQEQKREKRANYIGLESDEFLRFAVQIAKGMQHLEAKGITHRDLAARNILLDANLVPKVSDFGLSKNGIYVIAGSGRTRRLPVRWMSPEAMRDREFSSQSDVWSYGVVLWEIGTLGAFPYPDVRDDQLLRQIVVEGKRLAKPEAVSFEMYSVMQACWTSRSSERPSFAQLLSYLSELGGVPYFPYGRSNPCYASLPPTEEELQDNPSISPNIFDN